MWTTFASPWSSAHKWIKLSGDFRWCRCQRRPFHNPKWWWKPSYRKAISGDLFASFSQPRGPRSSFPAPSLHSEGSRALTKTRGVQSVHLVRPRAGGLGMLRKPEPRLQRDDKRTNPRLANHGAGKSPSGPPISSVKRPQVSPRCVWGKRRRERKRGQCW